MFSLLTCNIELVEVAPFVAPFVSGIPYLCHTEEQRISESLKMKHQDFDAKNGASNRSSSEFSSPAFTSPTGDQNTVTKGPLNITPEQKVFLDGIW